MYQHCQNPFAIKQREKKRSSLPKTMFLGVETTFRHAFPPSDLQCLPPDDLSNKLMYSVWYLAKELILVCEFFLHGPFFYGLSHVRKRSERFCSLSSRQKALSIKFDLLKIAEINTQQEKPAVFQLQKLVPAKNEKKKMPISKIKLPQKFPATR